ncbi:MAG: helix-turn-helix domain-containing protein [Eubacterium sp.]|nr:helix-turn-helix domain-containing protein [Eubacterium sp.]
MKSKTPISEKVTLSVREAADYSGIGVKSIYRLVNEHRDASFILNIGSHVRIKREEFISFLKEATVI